jgi:3-oxoacyl-[acyl-carrier protein] reductase
LAGKAALVTGSTRRGIGAATAMKLALDGASLILNFGTGSRDDAARERAERLRRQIAEPGRQVAVVEASVRNEEEVEELFRQSEALFGGVDILVNNAGGLWIEQDFTSIDASHWEQAVRTELDGAFYCTRRALPHMRHRRWGRIVNVGVDVDVMGLLINAQYGHVLDKYPYDFVLAKRAKEELAHLLGLVELKHGITVNNVLPGIIEEIDHEDAWQGLQAGAPVSVYFDPTDVARAVAFLCSEEARGISHSDIRVPGNIYKRL